MPLAELLNAFIDADFRLARIAEAADEDFPTRIGILAVRNIGGEATQFPAYPATRPDPFS